MLTPTSTIENSAAASEQLNLAALVERLPVELTSIEVKTTTFIEADPDLLAAALMNLLDNAVHHGAHKISMVVRAHGGSLRILPASTGFAIVLRLRSPQIGTLASNKPVAQVQRAQGNRT